METEIATSKNRKLRYRNFCFHIQVLFCYPDIEMAAIVCQVLPQFYRDYNDKTLFLSVSVKEYEPYLITKKYSVATHNDNFCPLKTCRYHIILISFSVKEILEEIENLSHVYQTVDCLYTPYKHQFFGSIIEE